MPEEKQNSVPETTGEKKPEEPLYAYRCHPAQRNRTITILVTLFLIVCVLLVWMISYSFLLTALAVVILFGSLGGFYFPTSYRFYEDHFVVKTTLQRQKKEWSQFRSYYPDRNGVLLSPFGRPTRLENFRGVYIKFAGNSDRVMQLVRSKIEFDEES
jgi:hypothetical protein